LPHGDAWTHDEFELRSSGLVPPHRQLPEHPFTSVKPLLHAEPSPVPAQQARWPALPHAVAGVTQCPLELTRNGFAEPPHRQLPEHPGTSPRPLPHEPPLISSPPQQARCPEPPQGAAWRHVLFDTPPPAQTQLARPPLQLFTSVKPLPQRPDPSPIQQAR
jgi:hypothetical protein